MAIASLLVLPTTGCVWQSRGQAGAQQGLPQERGSGPIVVETAVAKTGTIGEDRIVTGTTEPHQQVTLRSQADGQFSISGLM
ncbi:hypothetical protein [Trichothermofontia sp.]